MDMELSPAGLDLLKRFEGFRSQTYFDVAGLATIGYGHCVLADERFSNGLTEPQAEQLLAGDVRAAELVVRALVKTPVTQAQFDALVDFVFNLGAGRLAGSTLLKKLNSGEYEAAAGQLLRWDHAGGAEIAGLKARRQAEFELWSGRGAQSQAAA
jgi:lysozyme